MSVATAFNGGAPAQIGSGGDAVTLVEGGTFCLSNRHGDVPVGTSYGLFFRDARVLSRWELRVDGQVAEALSVEATEAFAAQFILRRAPRSGLADSTLLIVRERLVADGLRETISLHNLDKESTVVSLELHADADFADLFAVKEGRAATAGADMHVADGELVLRGRADRVRGLTVSASGDPIVLPGSLNWRVVVPPGPLADRGHGPADVVESQGADPHSAGQGHRVQRAGPQDREMAGHRDHGRDRPRRAGAGVAADRK